MNPLAVIAAALVAVSAVAQSTAQREVLVVALPEEAGWQEFAYLAAVPASMATNDGLPLVLTSGADGVLSAEARDFLVRSRPSRALWIGAETDKSDAAPLERSRLAGSDADAVACALAAHAFTSSDTVVVCSKDDYAGALVASVLAARLRVPLLYASDSGLSDGTRAQLERLGTTKVLWSGPAATPADAFGAAKVERLASALDALRCLQRRGRDIRYLAATPVADRTSGHARKLSLAAAGLAAGREGAIVPLGVDHEPAPTFDAARAAIAEHVRAAGGKVEHLCIAALPDTLPMSALAGTGIGIDTDPPSDLDYANLDADPFVDLAFGRFVAEDASSATLLAARSLAYDELLAAANQGRVGLAEWESGWEPVFANTGFGEPALHRGEHPIDAASPLASAAVLVHSAHSSWLQIGSTYAHDSKVLLAPCVVESGGCSPAALDSDAEHRSVALRMLRNGAIAFVGCVRRAIAEHQLYRSEFWNAVLAGESLGAAHKHALNRVIVACLARDEGAQGAYRYQLRNAAFYGDPALVLRRPSAPRKRGATGELRGREVTVRGPSDWSRVELYAPADWNYDASPAIYGWRGTGVGIEAGWDPQFRRNREVPVYTAEVRTDRPVKGMEALDAKTAPLGWDGRHFVDEHQDGTRSLYFRVHLVEFDMSSGKLLKQLDRLRFRLDLGK